MQLLRAATLTVPDVEATAARYNLWLDYEQVEAGRVSPELAESWGAPASAGKPYRVLRPASGAAVFLRLVQGETPADYQPLRTYCWAAIEICVQDTLAVHQRLKDSPFTVIGEPKELDGLPTIFPMQVRGPDQEIVYLTQIKADLPDYDLPRAASLVDKLFILVLAASDIAESLAWFEHALGLTAGREMAIIYNMLNDSFGLPQDQKHRLATMVHERDCFLEVDQYPPEATARPAAPGALPPGAAIASFLHPDLDTVRGDWIAPPAPRTGAIYGGGRTGTLRTPDGALVEVIEGRP